ncbi:hypothetical protein QQS21_011425 [Conoideocrella luteorostrata]|uniref:F-box domain-containing protein n=1 Tax=Conoideocrella luteorostrata TaxID=1105319 RepID=A0AAJ0CD50_9HYPO|nr:hypothetical protein QQS21_011425 [Conoideocrella luteorostrata]
MRRSARIANRNNTANQRATISSSKDVFRVTALPQEIRFMVYEFLFYGKEVVRLSPVPATTSAQQLSSPYRSALSLSQTCRTLRLDAQTLYGHRTVHQVSDLDISEYSKTSLLQACRAVRITIESVNYLNLLPIVLLHEMKRVEIDSQGVFFTVPAHVLNSLFDNAAYTWSQWLHDGRIKAIKYYGRPWESFIVIVADQSTVDVLQAMFWTIIGSGSSLRLGLPSGSEALRKFVPSH